MNAQSGQRVGIIGGTGFVGRVLCRRLAAAGHPVVVLTRAGRRHPDFEESAGLRLIEGNPGDHRFLVHALTGCEVVVNLAGILNEHGKGEFQAVHVDLPRTLGRACKEIGVRQVLHMSALGARAGGAPSRYLRSKGEGGNALQVELGGSIPWTIFRPSVIFGPGDDFTNRFARLLRLTPGVFPLACAQSRFAPVFVEDVAEAFVASVGHQASYRVGYLLCGPNQYSLQEIVAFVAATTSRRRRIVALPDRLARLQALVMEHLPGKPFSRDNYLSLQVDSVCGGGTADRDGFAELGIQPAAMETVVPQYLGAPGGA